ncbi:NAD(P)H dehydrogenase (quinone) [Salinisphaera shabanensis T35B1]|uniref:NAD(P)H-dependent oxidoreductase n=1 Tax=Salinisphaera shabanensis TaxID=180542 RepID=UPI00333F377D
MHAHIVFAHPEARSFNGALADIAEETLAAQGITVTRSDLYGERFDTVEGPAHYGERADEVYFSALAEQRHAGNARTRPADVQREIDRLTAADLVILQFPLWWHAQPAILKGWFDRVFVYGELYTGRRRYDEGHFRGKRALLSVTTGGPAATFSPYGRGGPIERLLWPIHYSLHYMGFDVLPPFVTHGIQGGGIAYEQRAVFEQHLENLKCTLDSAQPIPFTGRQDWDRDGVLRTDHPLRWA